MKFKKIFPIFLFVFTILQGAFLIYTAEKVQQQKQNLALQKRSYADEQCGSDHVGCENKERQQTVTCWNGQVKTCTIITKFLYDPCADFHVNNSCGKNYPGPSCGNACGDTIIGDCNCPPPPPPPPTATLTPTSTPTPTSTLTPTPTPTGVITPSLSPSPSVTVTPSPTSTPTPTPTPLIGMLTCGQKGCRDNSNPCQSGLTCVQGPDENYCALSALQTSCKNNPTFANCCTMPI